MIYIWYDDIWDDTYDDIWWYDGIWGTWAGPTGMKISKLQPWGAQKNAYLWWQEAAVSLSSSEASLPVSIPITIKAFDHGHDLKALLLWLEVQSNIKREPLSHRPQGTHRRIPRTTQACVEIGKNKGAEFADWGKTWASPSPNSPDLE